MSTDRVLVVGVAVDPATTEDVLRLARDAHASRRPARVSTINAEYVVVAQTDREFREAIQGADLATPDSAGILWALRRRGIDLGERVGGSDLIWSLSEQARRLGQSVFLLGGAEGVADRAAHRLERVYPGLKVAGTYAGSPNPTEAETIVDLIRRSGADILFVAFGAPKQDLWLVRNLGASGASLGIGVGGSFDYLAGTARRAPRWMRSRGVEWLWRLLRQPWRWRRMLALPRFIWLVLNDDGGAAESSGRMR